MRTSSSKLIGGMMEKKWLSYAEFIARLYACTMLSVYGLGKIMGGQFYQDGKIPESVALTPLAEVGSFDLAWTFFGYSFGYILFIGGSQVIGSLLLLFERTKILGAAILVPILMNIIIVDYFYEISIGAMMSAISYFIAINFVLFYNRERIFEAFSKVLIPPPKKEWKDRFIKLGIGVAGVIVLVLLENQMLNFVGR
ncbi:MAG: hypothetical protein JJ895_02220 [Balneolaceae bacterium]|nr:hypothetical protein [Balneolaceae bacterium]